MNDRGQAEAMAAGLPTAPQHRPWLSTLTCRRVAVPHREPPGLPCWWPVLPCPAVGGA